MERKCGNCLIWKQYNKVCPFFKEEMKEDSPACPKFTDTVYTLPKATTSALGGVMPDGTTITVDENGVISAVGGSDNWTNVGKVSVSSSGNTEFSIPNLSNYNFMMLSVSLGSRTSPTSSNNYTRILVLDDYKIREIKKIPTLSLDDAEVEIKRLKGLTFYKEDQCFRLF